MTFDPLNFWHNKRNETTNLKLSSYQVSVNWANPKDQSNTEEKHTIYLHIKMLIWIIPLKFQIMSFHFVNKNISKVLDEEKASSKQDFKVS